MQGTASQLVILTLTSSALALGAINVAAAVPLLLLSLIGGVFADQHDRRKIMIATQSLLGLFSVFFAYLIFTDAIQYWHVLLIATLSGVVASFELPASQAFVPQLVTRDDLPAAVALNSASFNTARIIGPSFASIAIGIAGLASAFLINALTILAPISALFALGKVLPQRELSSGKGSGLSHLKVGVRYVQEHEDMKGMVYLTALASFLVFPNIFVLMPLYLTDALGGGDSWVGIGLSVLGAGSLLGAILLLRGSRLETAAGRRQRSSIIGLTVAMIWLAFSPTPLIAMVGVAIAGYSFSTFNSQISTRVQQLAPDEIRGRLLSILSLAFNGVMPFATIAVSVAAEFVGQKVVMGVCAVALAIGCYIIYKRYAWKAYVAPEPILAAGTSL
jgi:MFS family permease